MDLLYRQTAEAKQHDRLAVLFLPDDFRPVFYLRYGIEANTRMETALA
ncbi:Uncharacterised protein [Salmonella bongori]|nr:Uncharacterised protein [Salmonella bongori]